jgi:hypothetical protein
VDGRNPPHRLAAIAGLREIITIGGGFYVKAILPGAEPENISGFKTKNDAIRWVRNDSALAFSRTSMRSKRKRPPTEAAQIVSGVGKRSYLPYLPVPSFHQ